MLSKRGLNVVVVVVHENLKSECWLCRQSVSCWSYRPLRTWTSRKIRMLYLCVSSLWRMCQESGTEMGKGSNPPALLRSDRKVSCYVVPTLISLTIMSRRFNLGFMMRYKDYYAFFSGTKHFLLMCNVRPEDSGEIKFVARHVDSAAYLDVEGMLSILSCFKCSALLVIYQFYAV